MAEKDVLTENDLEEDETRRGIEEEIFAKRVIERMNKERKKYDAEYECYIRSDDLKDTATCLVKTKLFNMIPRRHKIAEFSILKGEVSVTTLSDNEHTQKLMQAIEEITGKPATKIHEGC